MSARWVLAIACGAPLVMFACGPGEARMSLSAAPPPPEVPSGQPAPQQPQPVVDRDEPRWTLPILRSDRELPAPYKEPPPPPPPPASYPRPCAGVFDEGVLHTFELDVADEDWRQLQEEFALIQARTPGPEVWHPAVFRFAGEVHPDAMIRIRGNTTSCGEMQFAIAFNKINDAGRFQGMRRIDLDHGGCRLFQERLALSFMRDLGIPAACASHVRLVVNGAYYGLFLNLEHVNKDFLRRNFAEDDGNLYKHGRELTTNEETGDTSDLSAFWGARDLKSLDAIADLDHAIREWAAEAVLPARDNFWLSNWNYYLYHHPTRGFLFLPNDLDQTFPHADGEESMDSILPVSPQRPADLVLADPAWRARYLGEVHAAIAAYDVERFNARIDRWWTVVRDAAGQNPYKSLDEDYPRWLKGRVAARAAWLQGWSEQP